MGNDLVVVGGDDKSQIPKSFPPRYVAQTPIKFGIFLSSNVTTPTPSKSRSRKTQVN